MLRRPRRRHTYPRRANNSRRVKKTIRNMMSKNEISTGGYIKWYHFHNATNSTEAADVGPLTNEFFKLDFLSPQNTPTSNVKVGAPIAFPSPGTGDNEYTGKSYFVRGISLRFVVTRTPRKTTSVRGDSATLKLHLMRSVGDSVDTNNTAQTDYSEFFQDQITPLKPAGASTADVPPTAGANSRLGYRSRNFKKVATYIVSRPQKRNFLAETSVSANTSNVPTARTFKIYVPINKKMIDPADAINTFTHNTHTFPAGMRRWAKYFWLFEQVEPYVPDGKGNDDVTDTFSLKCDARLKFTDV